MLIYNYQKEFLGIDEKDLHTLGFNSFEELRAEVSDFADLFVKTPGYVHNFKHVHWIDFVNYADPAEELKVLISVNAKTFRAKLSISPLYLIDNPSSPAYMVHLNSLHLLSKSENENLSTEVFERELPKVEPQQAKTFTAPAPQKEEHVAAPAAKAAPFQAAEHLSPPTPPAEEEDELILDVFEEEENLPQTEAAPTTSTETAPQERQEQASPAPKETPQEQAWDNGYRYDPHVASKELGLPLDLIEEFIQDFIAQAKEFQPDIYNSIEEGDVDNVKILSHKLKGVAANLRIEDAHEVLSAVSATSDMDIIHENLDTFYKIIAKLAGEAPTETVTETAQASAAPVPEENEEEELTLDFKDDDISLSDIKDEDVPDKIEIPELADDDFLSFKDEEFTQTIEEEKEPSITSEPSITDEKISFSRAEAAKEIGIDEESFSELFDDFIQESKSIVEKMNSAVENDDLQKCRNEAIKLKGMSDNMRFHQLADELENLIHTQEKSSVTEILKKIDTAITTISNNRGA